MRRPRDQGVDFIGAIDYVPGTMPSVKIEKKSQLSAEESFKRISDLLTNDQDLRKLDKSYKVDFDAASKTGQASGSMFKAKMNVQPDGAGSKVEIVVDLPFTLALMKGMVEKQLAKKLEETLV